MAKQRFSLSRAVRQPSVRVGFLVIIGAGAFWAAAAYTPLFTDIGSVFSRSDASDMSARQTAPVACTTSADCGAGRICSGGVCGSVFSCQPLVDQVWKATDPVIPKGSKLEAKNEKYLSVVPVGSRGLLSRRMGAVRFQGGPMGEHTYERVLLYRFNKLTSVWGGRVEVNFKNFVDLNVTAPPVLAFMGGYIDPQWPESVPGAWLRDFVVNTHGNEAPTNGGYRYLGMTAYYHNSLATGGSQYPPILPTSLTNWPDRFVTVEWYFTPEKQLFARYDGGKWFQVHTNTGMNEIYTKFRGFAAGWVSSYLDSSIDIKRIALYDDACLPQ